MKRILVTGAGAILGQGILRCLRFSKEHHYIITADPDVRSPGHALSDKSYAIPLAKYKEEYLVAIENIIKKEKINVLFIGTDVELMLLATNKNLLETKFPVKIIVSSERVIEIASDKFLTSMYLKDNGFAYPISALTTDIDGIIKLKKQCSYPYIAKPVDGARSVGIKIINNDADLEYICSYKNNLVVQEMLSDEEGEFTSGCIVIDGKCKSIVSLRRDLRDGNTYRAYRDCNTSKFDDTIKQIAESLNIYGPSNFQYRIKNGQPVVFEINSRFSGTTPIRYMFGFNEVEALLNQLFNVKDIIQPELREGMVLRTFSDIFVTNKQLKEFSEKREFAGFQSEYFPYIPNKF